MIDILVVGGGTAGLTAGLYGVRAGKTVKVLEQKNYGGQIINSKEIVNYPGISKISGYEFATSLYRQATDAGVDFALGKVKSIRDLGKVKEVVAEIQGEEKVYEAKAVILAAGAKNRELGLPDEKKLTGAGVSYCATCDGMFFRGKEVAVVGGGNTAIQDAEFLSDYCSKVYLIHRRDEFRGENSGVKRLKEKENVEFILSATVKELVGESMVEKLILNDKKTGKDFELHVSGVFVAVGQIPKNETFADTVKLDEGGFVLASEDCLTSHPGIFAAGDCRTKEVRQLTTAAADGAVAALAACKYIADQSL